MEISSTLLYNDRAGGNASNSDACDLFDTQRNDWSYNAFRTADRLLLLKESVVRFEALSSQCQCGRWAHCLGRNSRSSRVDEQGSKSFVTSPADVR
jgi:hypothetical protein